VTERSKNLAHSRRRTSAALGRTPVTKLVRLNGFCLDELHLWCDGTVKGHRHIHECLCECHKGMTERLPLRAAR
jgi:hypothetical protein